MMRICVDKNGIYIEVGPWATNQKELPGFLNLSEIYKTVNQQSVRFCVG